MEQKKKIYIVVHESIRGIDLNEAFFNEDLAVKFTETIGCGGIREIEIMESIPDTFMFFTIFENGEVMDCGLWTNEKLRNSIAVFTPTRVSIIIDAPNMKSASEIARKRAIEYIRSAEMINMDVTYSLDDGSITQKSQLDTPMPMIQSMREQAIALLEHRLEDAAIHSVETVLLFWASPSSFDHIYRFNIVKGAEGSEKFDMSIPVSSSGNYISIRQEDKDEFLSIALRLGFEQVESDKPDILCLKRD